MLISPDEIHKSLANQGWEYSDKKIFKTFNFDHYLDGINFVNKIAELAETSNHHPDITIRWCKIDVTIFSHDMGGVTTKCVNLATSIDLI